jgi:glyoxylase-like metal-dependent hydrolase (beta-lactamase superfamily II)
MTHLARRSLFAAAACAAAVSASSAQQPPRPDPLVREGVTEKLSQHVYVIPDGSVPLVPNVGIVVGSRGTLVIDTGLGARNAQAVLREVEKVKRGPELYLATTHVHPEHDLGAMAFPPATRMLRSRDQEREIADTGLQMAQRFSAMSPINAELLKGAAFRPADIAFDTEHTVDLGGVRVRVLAMGTNHTRGDTAFFVEPDRVLFSGDVVMPGLPSLTSPASTLRGWLGSLDRLEALGPTRIVPSHGPAGDAALIAGYRTYFTTVRDRVAALKATGRPLDDVIKTVQEELRGRYDPQRMVSVIRAAYTEAP